MTEETKLKLMEELTELAAGCVNWVWGCFEYSDFEKEAKELIDKYTNTCTKEKS